MKRFVGCFLVISVALMITSSAMAKPFTTRKGIAFGMDADAIIAEEAKQKLVPKEGTSSTQVIFEDNVLFAKVPVILQYDFTNGSMNQMVYFAVGGEKEFKAIESQATKEFGKPIQDGVGEKPAFVTAIFDSVNSGTIINYTHWITTYDEYDVIADLWQTKDEKITLAISWVDQALSHPTLKSGAKGAGVRIIQEKLNQYGYLEGDPTGNFDKNTVKAIKDFQINNGLQETGICDAEVWETLEGHPRWQEIVYKSKKGKVYHSRSNCSGMKRYTEMTLSDALRKKLSPCSHCH